MDTDNVQYRSVAATLSVSIVSYCQISIILSGSVILELYLHPLRTAAIDSILHSVRFPVTDVLYVAIFQTTDNSAMQNILHSCPLNQYSCMAAADLHIGCKLHSFTITIPFIHSSDCSVRYDTLSALHLEAQACYSRRDV